MSQSGFIAAMLLAAFVIWLAINDRLTAYTNVLFGPTQAPKPQGNISNQNGIIAPSATGSATGGSGPAGLLPDIGGGGGDLLKGAGEVAGLLEFLP